MTRQPVPATLHPTFSRRANKVGRTIWRWRTQISNWHASHVSNGPTEAANTHTGGALLPGRV